MPYYIVRADEPPIAGTADGKIMALELTRDQVEELEIAAMGELERLDELQADARVDPETITLDWPSINRTRDCLNVVIPLFGDLLRQ